MMLSGFSHGKTRSPAIVLKWYLVILSFPYPIRHVYVNVGAKIVDLVSRNLIKQTNKTKFIWKIIFEGWSVKV